MRKLPFWLVVSIFLIVNVVFNASLWQKLWQSRVSGDIYSSDATITELLTETSYSNVRAGKSPFAPTNKLFYPFGMDFALNDPGTIYVVPFLFLRPFFTLYQSMVLSILLFLFLASVAMYGLLRHLRIDTWVALLFSLVFSYMPFISHRLQGHYTYLVHFLFPLVYLFFHSFFQATTKLKKTISTILISLSLAATLYANFYYFILMAIALAFYVGWCLIFHWRLFWATVSRNIMYLLLMPFIFVLAILPWLQAVRTIILFEGMDKIPGFGGAMQYSADIFSLFIPNQYNYLYRGLAHILGSFSPHLARLEQYFLHDWEVFVYPGLILLFVYGWIIVRLKQHTLPRQLWQRIRVPFFMSLVFAILALGPFLKIASIWHINLDGVEVLFPLPFLLLRSLPLLGGLRVPTRFSPGFVFFGCLVGASVLSYLLRHKYPRKYGLVIGLLLGVFVLDQHYFVPVQTDTPVPVNIYNYLKDQPSDATVMEIPLTVRDGLQYKGFVHALSPMQGLMVHGHPIIGGYFARVGQSIFDYYDTLPFVGYMLDITDRGNYNPIYEKPQDPHIYPFTIPIARAQAELDFLNIGYVILKNDEPYSAQARSVLTSLGLAPIKEDHVYTLYQRAISHGAADHVQFGSVLDYLHIGRGLATGEPGREIMIATRAEIFLSIDSPARYTTLHIMAASASTTHVRVFINRQPLGEIEVTTAMHDYSFPVAGSLIPHVNSVMLLRSKTSDPVYYAGAGLE